MRSSAHCRRRSRSNWHARCHRSGVWRASPRSRFGSTWTGCAQVAPRRRDGGGRRSDRESPGLRESTPNQSFHATGAAHGQARHDVQPAAPARELGRSGATRGCRGNGVALQIRRCQHRLFCPPSPPEACAPGNGEVRSPRDNVPSGILHTKSGWRVSRACDRSTLLGRIGPGHPAARRQGDCQHQGGQGPEARGMVNPGSDRDCDLAPRESGLTSLGCRRTRTVRQPAREATQNGRRGRKDRCWCGLHHRTHFGSRLCRSNVQVAPPSGGTTACPRGCVLR